MTKRKCTTPTSVATRRIITAIQNGKQKASYQDDLNTIESEARDLTVEIIKRGM